MNRFHVGRGFAVALVLSMYGSAALADAIDGDWCSTVTQQHVRIAGPKVTTPAGRQMTGDYSRHAFRYVVPEGEEGAGGDFSMQLLNEEQARVSIAGSPPELWHRCQLSV